MSLDHANQQNFNEIKTIKYWIIKKLLVSDSGVTRYLQNLTKKKDYNKNYYILKPDCLSTNLKPKKQTKKLHFTESLLVSVTSKINK